MIILTRILLFRIAGPTIFMSVLFLGSCITAAIYLHHQQSTSLRILDEDLQSRQYGADLLRELHDLIALPRDRRQEAAPLHKKIQGLLARAKQAADKREEARLVARLEASFDRYLERWQAEASLDSSSSENADKSALGLLEAETVPAARALEHFNAGEIGRAEVTLDRTVTWMAWGFVGVGTFGSLAGLLLGYGVARGLGRTVLRAESLAEVGEIAAGMAHELRNPLTAIKMLVQMNREETEAQGLPAEDLQVIEQEILRMEARLNVFIDFARPPKPERRRVNLAAVVDQTLALVGGRARKQRVTVKFTPPSTPVEVEADGEQVRQLLVNLALNALDVMPRGGILEIDLRPPANEIVELAVLDTGPGIPPRHLSRLYEPFFTSKEMGLGLGLVVSQRIAQDHGGELRATNRPQGGACFVLRLPATPSVG
ncbi:two-component system, NtrC family, sensor histidine kinase HydH [Singulisphaera sp. GP187]|nr:two-component system, NtrC family, sensor histidine kinase HydH [Singulisphaera sp. GP187]